MGTIRRFTGPRGTMVFDDRFWPIMITTWYGTADEGQVDQFFDACEDAYARATAANLSYQLITDTISADRPDAAVRAAIARRTKSLDERYPAASALNAGSFVIIESTLIRGALTAIGWLTGGMTNEMFASCSQALGRARELYLKHGQAWPAELEPERYRRLPQVDAGGS